MSNKKKKEINVDDLKDQLKQITERYNEAIKQKNISDEVAKRCLGAIEVLQGLTQDEEEEQDAEVRKEK